MYSQIRVLPTPGGPCSSIPRGGLSFVSDGMKKRRIKCRSSETWVRGGSRSRGRVNEREGWVGSVKLNVVEREIEKIVGCG